MAQVFEYGEPPSDSDREQELNTVRRITAEFFNLSKDEKPGLIVSACLSLSINLALNANDEAILIILDCLENMKTVLKAELRDRLEGD